MLLSLLPIGLVELGLNQLLQLDTEVEAKLGRLAGKRLRLELDELGRPLTVSVFEREMRLSIYDEDAVDCAIRTKLAVLPELRDSANITRLIKADALDIEGDPMLAQQLSQLIKELDIDWEDQLAKRIGDVGAHWVSQTWQRSRAWFEETLSDQQSWLQEVLLEEKKVLVGRTEYSILKDDLQSVRAAVDRLERQLKKDR